MVSSSNGTSKRQVNFQKFTVGMVKDAMVRKGKLNLLTVGVRCMCKAPQLCFAHVGAKCKGCKLLKTCVSIKRGHMEHN